ncbi:hypothetical protein CONLIGDRAFT_649926 [Coniochaeta ligniaria NRRL 30616]|uniref:Molybdopterin oxidoreductase domain-containing protein n=1 Tax=Coniochaeta ligniaria NRRL 30616 TaxID=1408157 RepID=A0A1J7I6F1_9PEZI|nr:hypothetical protein CONLIGDRAFT_649926 [Coniochaeta ligniaria NRRL 30616]
MGKNTPAIGRTEIAAAKVGTDYAAPKKALAGLFSKKLLAAKSPMVIVSSAVTNHPNAKAFYQRIGAFVDKDTSKFLSEEQNGYNILFSETSLPGAFEVGFVMPSGDEAQVSVTPRHRRR